MSALVTPGLGDLVCTPIGGETGDLIDLGEWLCGDGFHKWAHTELYVGEIDGVPSTFSAYPGGATTRPLPPVAEQVDWLWSTGHIELTDEQRQGIVATALSLKGTPYSALDYFALAGHHLHIPDPDHELEDYIKSTKHMICSQICDYAYMMNGVHLFNDNRWAGYVMPADIGKVILHPEGIVYGLAA